MWWSPRKHNNNIRRKRSPSNDWCSISGLRSHFEDGAEKYSATIGMTTIGMTSMLII